MLCLWKSISRQRATDSPAIRSFKINNNQAAHYKLILSKNFLSCSGILLNSQQSVSCEKSSSSGSTWIHAFTSLMKKPITIHIVTNLGQNKIGIEI